MVDITPLIISNESITGDTKFEVTSPATGQVLSHCASASLNDANRAVDTAKAVFPAWSLTKSAERRDIMFKAADIMESRKEELVKYQMEETGAARPFVEHSFMMGVDLIKDVAGRISTIEGRVPTAVQDNAMVLKEPYGVVLGIAPWYNYCQTLSISYTNRFCQECSIYSWNSGRRNSPGCRKHDDPQGLGAVTKVLLGDW